MSSCWFPKGRRGGGMVPFLTHFHVRVSFFFFSRFLIIFFFQKPPPEMCTHNSPMDIRKQKTSEKNEEIRVQTFIPRNRYFSKFSNLNSSEKYQLVKTFLFFFRFNRTAHVSRVPQNPNSTPHSYFSCLV